MRAVLFLVPAALQAASMLVDEGWFHRRRELPRWERIGHPVDTLTTVACYGWLAMSPTASLSALYLYVGLALFSCLFITKDEFVHAKLCQPGEVWLHSVLFVLHPIVFAGFGILWWTGQARGVLLAQLFLSVSFAIYQVVYWNLPWKRTSHSRPSTTRSTLRSASAGTTLTTTR